MTDVLSPSSEDPAHSHSHSGNAGLPSRSAALSVYVGAIVSIVVFGTALGLLVPGASPQTTDGGAPPGAVLSSPGWLCAIITVNAFAGLAALLVGVKLLGTSRRTWCPTPRVPVRVYVGGLLLVLGTAPVADLAAQWAGLVTGTKAASANIALMAAIDSSAAEFAAVLVAVAVGPAVAEELLFRGFITAAFSRFGTLAAAVWPSVLFGLYHIEVAQSVGTTLLGLAFGLVRLRAGSVLPSMVAHGAYNATVLLTLRAAGRPEAGTPDVVDRLPILGVGALLLLGATVLLRAPSRASRVASASSPSSSRKARLAMALDRGLLRLAGLRTAAPSGRDPIAHQRRLDRLARLATLLHETPQADLWPEPSGAIPAGALAVSPTEERTELCWLSSHRLVLPSAQRWYDACPQNSQARARVWLSAVPRPVVIIVHGYRGGHSSLERLAWPAEELRRLGFDVCWLVLPFHGRRAGGWLRPPQFPGRHPDLNAEALRQGVLDLRELAAWLRQRGHPWVGIIGHSLGGYVAALAATVESALDLVVLLSPAASVEDFARDHGTLGEGPERNELHAALKALYAPLSPLARPSLVPAERWLVLSGDSDAVTGPPHARALANRQHARLQIVGGGHALLPRRRDVWRAVNELLLGSAGELLLSSAGASRSEVAPQESRADD